MKHYIEELKRQLHEIMERPVTLGRAEEVTVYADAICALHKLDDDHQLSQHGQSGVLGFCRK